LFIAAATDGGRPQMLCAAVPIAAHYALADTMIPAAASTLDRLLIVLRLHDEARKAALRYPPRRWSSDTRREAIAGVRRTTLRPACSWATVSDKIVASLATRTISTMAAIELASIAT